MKLTTIKYKDYKTNVPQEGQHIIGQERGENIIVYQAFNPRIATYAVANQQFGGAHYSFSRMSWIKPNFLWMMYRAGWASKEHQQHILAIEISKVNFLTLLSQAVHSSFKPKIYGTKENWKNEMHKSETKVRLQWDPDHGPRGGKLDRRAIQLGLKGEILRQFGTEWIVSIEDITPFVKEQKAYMDKHKNLDDLLVIEEYKILIEDQKIIQRLRLDV